MVKLQKIINTSQKKKNGFLKYNEILGNFHGNIKIKNVMQQKKN